VRESVLTQAEGSWISGNFASQSGAGAHVQDGGTLIDFNVTNNHASGSVVIGGDHSDSDFGDGGGVSVVGGVASLVRLVVTNNTAARRGGAVAAVGSAVSVLESLLIQDCIASDGGGIFVGDGGSFDGSAVTNLWDCSASRGGGAFLAGTTGIRRVAMRNLHASEAGGGITCGAGRCAVELVDVLDTSSARFGGHVAVLASAVLDLTDVVLLRATAEDGGSVFMDSGSELHTATTAVSTTQAHHRGGAVYCRGCSAILGPLVIEDSSAREGGGWFVTVYDRGSAGPRGDQAQDHLDDVRIEEVEMTRTTALTRGGSMVVETVWRPHNDPVLQHRQLTTDENFVSTRGEDGSAHHRKLLLGDVCLPLGYDATNVFATASLAAAANTSVVTFQQAVLNGTIQYCVPPRLTMRTVSLSFGTSQAGVGGCIAAFNSTLRHRKLSVTSCNATAGGGMFLNSSTMEGVSENTWSTLEGNEATLASWNTTAAMIAGLDELPSSYAGHGGNVYATGSTSLSRFHVLNGKAWIGGGLALQDGQSTVGHVRVHANVALLHAGGMHASNVALKLDTVTLSANDAAITGGGGHFVDSHGSMDSVSIFHNNAVNGTGIWLQRVTLHGSDNHVYQNPRTHALSTHGGGVFVAAGNCSLSGVRVASCTAQQAGGGVFMSQGASCAFDRMLVRGNVVERATGVGGGVSAESGTSLQLLNSQVLSNVCAGSGTTAWWVCVVTFVSLRSVVAQAVECIQLEGGKAGQA